MLATPLRVRTRLWTAVACAGIFVIHWSAGPAADAPRVTTVLTPAPIARAIPAVTPPVHPRQALAIVVDVAASPRDAKARGRIAEVTDPLVSALEPGDTVAIVTATEPPRTLGSIAIAGVETKARARALLDQATRDIPGHEVVCMSCGLGAGSAAIAHAPMDAIRRVAVVSGGWRDDAAFSSADHNEGVTMSAQWVRSSGIAIEYLCAARACGDDDYIAGPAGR